jgi:hypothetical protein
MKHLILALSLSIAACSTPTKPSEPAPPLEAKVMQKSEPVIAPSAAHESSQWTCSKDKDVRVLAVAAKGAGCSLNYTKAEKSTEVASSVHGDKHCKSSQEKLRAKLEKSGFTCKEG